jgi:TolB protein
MTRIASGQKVFSTAVVVALFVALSFASTIPDDWKAFVDEQLHVAFRYPKTWKTSPVYYDRTYFGGPDGEVQLDAAGGPNIKDACRGSAEHHLRPYGEHPVIRSMKIGGRNACLVWPSADQGAPWYAELIVEYPEPIEIDGYRYTLLMMNADKTHMLRIIQTLKFLHSPAHTRKEKPESSEGRVIGK